MYNIQENAEELDFLQWNFTILYEYQEELNPILGFLLNYLAKNQFTDHLSVKVQLTFLIMMNDLLQGSKLTTKELP